MEQATDSLDSKHEYCSVYWLFQKLVVFYEALHVEVFASCISRPARALKKCMPSQSVEVTFESQVHMCVMQWTADLSWVDCWVAFQHPHNQEDYGGAASASFNRRWMDANSWFENNHPIKSLDFVEGSCSWGATLISNIKIHPCCPDTVLELKTLLSGADGAVGPDETGSLEGT